ncbi:hypothetical protein [Yinghuangia sp. YIM S09857]|uniref:hypothetical protein n=1 Tax=Yinghuangia sp. YIM S09857 TaxID=3436929 RepID=UPI003F530863
MRRLADDLGVDPMSIYHHIKGKAALLDAICEAVIAEVELGQAPQDWEQAARQTAYTEDPRVVRGAVGANGSAWEREFDGGCGLCGRRVIRVRGRAIGMGDDAVFRYARRLRAQPCVHSSGRRRPACRAGTQWADQARRVLGLRAAARHPPHRRVHRGLVASRPRRQAPRVGRVRALDAPGRSHRGGRAAGRGARDTAGSSRTAVGPAGMLGAEPLLRPGRADAYRRPGRQDARPRRGARRERLHHRHQMGHLVRHPRQGVSVRRRARRTTDGGRRPDPGDRTPLRDLGRLGPTAYARRPCA